MKRFINTFPRRSSRPLQRNAKRHLLGEEEESSFPLHRPSALNPKIQVARNCVSTVEQRIYPSWYVASWMWREATKQQDVTTREKKKKKKKVIRGEKCTAFSRSRGK